jgi:L-ascorbate metabolism protein UlaG (beta-lactamase superfamily)
MDKIPTNSPARSVFLNGKYQNQHPQAAKSLFAFLKMTREHPFTKWPAWVDSEYGPKPPERVNDGSVQVTVINQSSVLVQTAGYNILTDPVYSERVSPFTFAGPKRVRNPGLRFEDLPPIDVIVISHDHYDHLDTATVKRLIDRDNPAIYVGLGVAKHIRQRERVTELDWWESASFKPDFTVTFAPTQHFSGRGLFDRDSTLWGAVVLTIAGRKIYFGGDTGYADHFQKTYEQLGAMDVALLPIGAYAPRNFMGPMHMDPKQAVQAHLDLHAKWSVGMHYATFQMTSEAIDEPEQLLIIEREKAGLKADEFVAIPFGQALIIND